MLLRLGALEGSVSLQCAFIEFESWFAGSAYGDAASSRDTVKAYLSQPSKSQQLQLWLAFAAFEARLGNTVECRRVLERAAGLSGSIPAVESRHRFRLWLPLVMLACPIGSSQTNTEALYMLCSATENTSTYASFARAVKAAGGDASKLVTPVRLLKARSTFQMVGLFPVLSFYRFNR